MMDNIDEVADKRLVALRDLEYEKLWVAKACNKRVQLKIFQIVDLVWKVLLGSWSQKFKKWSQGWEGLPRIMRIVSDNSYMVESIEGHMLPEYLMDD